MKRITAIILSVLIMTAMAVPAFAKDADYDFTAPDWVKPIESGEDGVEAWASEDETFMILFYFEDNTDNVNMSHVTEEQKEKFTSELKEDFSSEFEVSSDSSTENGEVKVGECKDEKIGEYYCVTYEVEMSIPLFSMYEKVYMFASVDHLYSFGFVCNDKTAYSDSDFEKILSEFKINEKMPLPKTTETIFIVVGAIVTIIIIAVITIAISNMKKKQQAKKMQQMNMFGDMPQYPQNGMPSQQGNPYAPPFNPQQPTYPPQNGQQDNPYNPNPQRSPYQPQNGQQFNQPPYQQGNPYNPQQPQYPPQSNPNNPWGNNNNQQ